MSDGAVARNSSLLRIGGNSVDKTTWEPTGPGAPPEVAPSDIDALAGFLSTTGWQVLYGTNLATSPPALAAARSPDTHMMRTIMGFQQRTDSRIRTALLKTREAAEVYKK
jgi:hypothetical protein